MRDGLLILVVFASLLAAMRYPFVGLIVWGWFSLMTPHQMAYGAFGLPLNLVIAAATMGAIIVHGAFRDFRFDAVTFFLFLLAAWLTLSQAYSLDPASSAIFYDRFIKTLLFVLLCVQMTTTKLRLHALLWMLVISIGFFAAKGALFTVATLGQYRVQGVPLTILEDNNHMGIAMATILPMIVYLRGQVTNRYVRVGLAMLFGMTVFSILGTHSRGAFLALMMFGGYFWWRSRHKVQLLALLVILLIPGIAFMPAKWTERMATIGEATQDESFMGRVDAWVINYKFAEENPLTGAGLRNPYQKELAEKVDPERAPRAKAAHSIYFEILGGSGFVGLAIFLSLFGAALFKTIQLCALRNDPRSPPWLSQFGYYAQISLAVFALGGASVSMEMWDGYLLIIALIAAATRLKEEALEEVDAARDRIRKTSWRIKARGAAPVLPRVRTY